MSKTARLLQQAMEQAEAGRAAEAIALCEQAVRSEPRNFLALSLAALLEQGRGRHQEALVWAEKAVKAGPSNPQALSTAGTILLALNRYAEAADRFRKALSVQPDLPGIHAQLAVALQKTGQLNEALASYRIALKQNPDADLLSNFSGALEQSCEYEQATEVAQRALALQPQSAEALNHLGSALFGQGRVEEALQAHDRALNLKPDHVEARYNRSLVLLMAGDFARGWAEYEWRWRWSGFSTKRPDFPQPAWDGGDPGNRTILVYGEQGIGDVIQFLRYVPLLARRGARVVLACPVELHQLVQGMEGVDHVVKPGEPIPAFDAHVAVMSLPSLLKTTLDNVPANIPYLPMPPAAKLPLASEPGGPLKVGIVWSGGNRYPKTRLRSTTLEQFLPLLRLPGIRFYSLQCGPRAADLKTLPPDIHVEDLSGRLHDFACTAAAVGQLDVVISVCTSVLHLAGALGRPVWGVISHVPCWRWMRERTDSPWYPTLRLFRQLAPGDWPGVFVQIEAALRQLTHSRSKQPQP